MWGLVALHVRFPTETIAWEGKETLPGPRKQAERIHLTRNQHYSFGLPKMCRPAVERSSAPE
jgi:hypothetical protein